MGNKNFLKFFVFFIIAVLILNLILFAMKKVNELLFWVIIIIAAVFAYKILPKMRN